MLGVLQPVMYFVFENYGLKYTTTSFTGIVSSVSPIFTAILGAIMLKERPNMKQWACIGISIVGAGIYWDRKPVELDHDPHADDFNKDIWEG